MARISHLLGVILPVLCCYCILPTEAWVIPVELAEDVAHILHAPAAVITDHSSPLLPRFRIHTELQGSGFHRDLNIQLYDTLNDSHSLLGCQTTVLQPLPSSIYVDPYQLEDLIRSSRRHRKKASAGSRQQRSSSLAGAVAASTGSNYSFTLVGPLDLELPAPACQANALLLSFSFSSEQGQLQASLSVPLHAKYPEPRAFGFAGWQVLSSGHVQVVVPQPWLLLDCRAAGGELYVLQPKEHVQPALQPERQQYSCARESSCNESLLQSELNEQQQLLLWSVPAGNLDHSQLVSWATVFASAACCVMLSVRALQVMQS